MIARSQIESHWQPCAANEAAQQGFGGRSLDRLTGEGVQLGGVVNKAAGRRDAFAMSPDTFGRIEFRGIGRKVLQMNVANRRAPALEVLPLMLYEVVQQDHERCAERPPQAPEMRNQVDLIHAATGKELGEEAAAPACGRDSDRTEHRELFAVSQPVQDDGRLADRPPRAAAVRLCHEPRFVEEDKRGSELSGLFLIRGQPPATQTSTAVWLRS